MNSMATLETMKDLRLFGMHQWLNNAIETGLIHDLSTQDALSHLIESEKEERFDRRLKRLIKNTQFRFICHLEEIRYTAERNLEKKTILKISELRWLRNGEHIVLTGCTGTGKTFLACAIGMKACLEGYRVQYVPANKLFYQLKYAKSCGNYVKFFEKLMKNELIIIDDFGLEVLDRESRMSLFEILENQTDKKSILFSSQLPMESWFDVIGDKTLADAICDRVISGSHFVCLEGDSLRRMKPKKS